MSFFFFYQWLCRFFRTSSVRGADLRRPLLDGVVKCVVCDTNERNFMLPCKHISICFDCAHKLTECPVCRHTFDRGTHVFIS